MKVVEKAVKATFRNTNGDTVEAGYRSAKGQNFLIFHIVENMLIVVNCKHRLDTLFICNTDQMAKFARFVQYFLNNHSK